LKVTLKEQRLGGFRWLVLRGPAEEAFAALGAYMRAEICEVLTGWAGMARLREHVASPPARHLLAAVREASAARFPGIWDELGALAEGAQVPLDDLALLNFRGDLGHIGLPAADSRAGCSDLAWARRRCFIAHNEDQAGFYEGRCLVLTLALQDQQPVSTFWVPGFLPGTTFSVTSAGTVWAIDHLPVSSPGHGAGRHLVARGLQREAGDARQALQYLRENRSAGGFAYMIADGTGRIVNVESAAGQYAWREAGPDDPLIWHTNHGRYITGADASPGSTSLLRGRVLGSLQVPSGDPDISWFARVLAAAPLPHGVRAEPSLGGQKTATVCTFVASLSDGEAWLLWRGAEGVRISLADLVRGDAINQREQRLEGGW
jgi:hypothetical protein